MKKVIMSIMEKWFVTIVTTIVLLISTALWDYINRFYSVPQRMDAWEQRAHRDSLVYSTIINQNHKEDSIQNCKLLFISQQNYRDSSFLVQDYLLFLRHGWIK